MACISGTVALSLTVTCMSRDGRKDWPRTGLLLLHLGRSDVASVLLHKQTKPVHPSPAGDAVLALLLPNLTASKLSSNFVFECAGRENGNI